MVICWKRLFCGMHCFMISICDTESQFNDGTNEMYQLLNHLKELKQKTFEHEKLPLLKSTQNTKNNIKYQLPLKKEKNIKSEIYQEYFQIKFLILPKNHHCDVPL